MGLVFGFLNLTVPQAAVAGVLTTLLLGLAGLTFGRIDTRRTAQATAKKTAFDMVNDIAATLQEDVKLARSDAASNRDRLTVLEGERGALRLRLEGLEAERDQLHDHLTRLQADHAATVRDRDVCRIQIVKLEAEIVRLRATLAGLVERQGAMGERQDAMQAGLRQASE